LIKSKDFFDFNSKEFKKSIYFSDIDPLSSLEFTREIEKPHKIDLMILKIERLPKNELQKDNFDNRFDYFQNERKSKTFLNLKLSKNFYDVNLCIDEIDSPNKNQIFKEIYNLKPNKKYKLIDYSHTDIINILHKNDFTEINPKLYNDDKIAKRYNNINYDIKNQENDEDNSNEIKREFEKCFKKFEFLNNDSPRYLMHKSENFNLMKILNQTNINIDNVFESNHILDNYLDIKLGNLITVIKNYVNDFIKWENNNVIIELNFIFENSNLNDFVNEENENASNIENFNKFVLNNIFVYFMQMPKLELTPELITLINNNNQISAYEDKLKQFNKNNIDKDHYISLIRTHDRFENIFIDYKYLNKQIKFSKNFLDSKKSKINTKDLNDEKNKTNPLIKSFSTLQRESIFHNRLNFKLNLDKNEKEIINSNKNNKICLLIYQHLTEDTYIEKNEFKLHLNKIFIEYETQYFFSDEIDQEISSDISKQYFASFAICSSIEFFRNKFFEDKILYKSEKKQLNKELEISFPIHFRYQPPIYNTYHQEVFLNLPLIEVIIQEDQFFSIEKSLINNRIFEEKINLKKALNYKSNRKQIKDYRKIFTDEIRNRLTLINDYKLIFDNLTKIRHFIPAGKMEHLYLVISMTFIVTLIGFCIIVFGIINNKIKEKII